MFSFPSSPLLGERETPNQYCEDPKTPPLRDSSRLRVSPLVVLGVFGGFSVCGWVCTEGLMFACGLTHPPHAQPSLVVHPLSISSGIFPQKWVLASSCSVTSYSWRVPSPHSHHALTFASYRQFISVCFGDFLSNLSHHSI